jgi:transcription elongation GreA/GreB family factor
MSYLRAAMSLPVKEKIVKALLAEFSAKADDLQNEIQSLEASRNNESKSTAGDKHEVGRAMAQTELDTMEKRLATLKEQANTIKNLPLDLQNKVGRGSLVETSNGLYFLAVGFGKVEVGGKSYFVISPAAPIGQAMLGKKAGDQFEFRGQNMAVRTIK